MQYINILQKYDELYIIYYIIFISQIWDPLERASKKAISEVSTDF